MKVKVIQNTTNPQNKSMDKLIGCTLEVQSIVLETEWRIDTNLVDFEPQDLQILPDDSEFTPGEEIEVSDSSSGGGWKLKKFIGLRNVIPVYKHIVEDKDSGKIESWKYARKIKQIPKFTKAEVAAKLGVEDFEII